MRLLPVALLTSALSSCAVYPVPGGVAVQPILPQVGVYVAPPPAPYYGRPNYRNDYEFYSHHPEANPNYRYRPTYRNY